MKDKMGKELTMEEVVEKVMKRIESILSEFGVLILHMAGYIPSHYIRRFFYRIAGIEIGKGSTIHMGARFHTIGQIKIGFDSIIGEGVALDGRNTITIGNHVDIASEVMIYTAQHDVDSQDFQAVGGPVVIEDYVFIGPRAIILPDITIKKGAVIAAGAVVTKNVSENAIVGGVPAKTIRQRMVKDLHYKLGRARWFR